MDSDSTCDVSDSSNSSTASTDIHPPQISPLTTDISSEDEVEDYHVGVEDCPPPANTSVSTLATSLDSIGSSNITGTQNMHVCIRSASHI